MLRAVNFRADPWPAGSLVPSRDQRHCNSCPRPIASSCDLLKPTGAADRHCAFSRNDHLVNTIGQVRLTDNSGNLTIVERSTVAYSRIKPSGPHQSDPSATSSGATVDPVETQKIQSEGTGPWFRVA